MQKFKILRRPLLGETAHFGFCPPRIGFFRGLGGVPEIFFLHWNLRIFVIFGRAECVRCPWLLAQTKVATIFGIFPLVGVLVLTRPPITPEGIIVGF